MCWWGVDTLGSKYDHSDTIRKVVCILAAYPPNVVLNCLDADLLLTYVELRIENNRDQVSTEENITN